MKKKTDTWANDIDTESVEETYPTDDTIHGLPWDGFDVDRTQVAHALAAKVHFGKEECICRCL